MKKYWLIAVCVFLVIAVVIGVYVLKDDGNTEIFIDDFDVSTDGLASGETKEVCTDITTKTSTYSKTDRVEGFVIAQDAPTLEEIKKLVDYEYPEILEGIHYKCDSEYKLDESLGFEVHDKSFLEKYDGDELIWRVPFTKFVFYEYTPVNSGVIVYGTTPTWSSNQKDYAWMSKVNEDGNILWKCQLDNGFDDEYIEAIVENGDGTYAVFSRGDYEYLCLSQYDDKGNRTSFNKTKVDNYGIWNAVRSSDGYIVQLGSYMTNEHAKIIKTDHLGNITDTFSYESDDSYWYITDAMEFEGKIYISAYSVPKCPDDETAGGRYEIANIVNHMLDVDYWNISSEELTPMVRDNYTATLIICDSSTGTPEQFYSISGSLGRKLAISDYEEVIWDVESVVNTYFSPATSSFSIGGTCNVFRYTFNKNGTLVDHEKTEEFTEYRR